MSISTYNIYVQSCIDLARSVIIKSEATARAINMVDQYKYPDFFDPYNPKTWRYYMHLAGQYHPFDLDAQGKPKIRVLSIDTIEEIDFTVENLREHRATWREYQKGSTFYKNLIQKYPLHVKLIDGILNPINIDEAIAAEDNKILWYDNRFVEFNEYTVIERLQEMIDAYYHRWDNNDYELTDDLYVPAKIGILYTYMPYMIMQIRHDACRTIEAHSFHVWNYLGSHQWLDEYRGHLNLYQRLWLYRNIRWVEANAGKMESFKKLIEVVMTERRLPIAEFHSRRIIDGMEDPNRFTPEIDMKRTPLNMQEYITKAGNIRTVDELMDKSVNDARDNEFQLEENKIEINKRFKRSIDNSLSTKVLESHVIDNSKRQAIRHQDVELNEWIYMVSQGLYNAQISVSNPKTAQVMSMNQKDALIVFTYSLLRSYLFYSGETDRDEQLDPVYIPTILARDVLRRRKPTLQQVRNVVDTRYVNPQYLYAFDEFTPPVEHIVSTEKFADFVQEVVKTKNLHREMYSFTEDAREHIGVKTLRDQYYETVICTLTDKKMRFDDYFKYNGFEVSNMKREEYAQLALDIYRAAVGSDLVKRYSLREIQGMMIRLLKQLSSYSIQFVRTINEENTIVVDWPYMRAHRRGLRFKAGLNLNLTNIDDMYHRVKQYQKNEDPIFITAFEAERHVSQTFSRSKDNGLILDIKEDGRSVTRSSFRMPDVQFTVTDRRLGNIIPKPIEEPTWDLDKFRIHKGTEERSRVSIDDEGNLIVRGVVYVGKDYNGKEK